MEKLTARKKLSTVRLYLSGLSYGEIASKVGVSKGTVANVVAELKAGSFPEAADIAEHIESLRELSIDLKRTRLTPGQCAIGLMLLNRVNELGLEPADIDRWPLILKAVPTEDDAKEFVRLVYSIQQVQQKSGLSLEALDNKARELQKEAAELGPISDEVKDCRNQLIDLTRQREELASSVGMLERKSKLLTPRVKDLERRERTLSRRIADMEPKAQKAETTLSALKREIQKLEDTGLTLKELTEFQEKLQGIAQHHGIKSSELRSRLLRELGSLDKGLTFETLIQSRQQEMDKTKQTIARSKNEIEAARAVIDSLKQEKMNLEADIRETREKVSQEIAMIIPIAQDTIARLREELQRGNEEALVEVRRLRDEALEVGSEVGRCQGILQASEWLNDLSAFIRGAEGITGNQVRILVLPVVRGLGNWLKCQHSYSLRYTGLSLTAERLINDLEAWET